MINTVPAYADNFAGGGGASKAYEIATGKSPTVALNHNKIAMALHRANHPDTHHVPEDIRTVASIPQLENRPLYSHYSPDCRHFSAAAGAAPVSESVRGLANVVIRDAMRYENLRMFTLENVKEFLDWGPLLPCGTKPDKSKKGEDFTLWRISLAALGFTIEWRLLNAMHYGAATNRTRLFIVGRRDGEPIHWPKHTHGPNLLPYKSAGSVLDFSLPTPSVFLTPQEAKAVNARRPLVDNTLRRIFKGVDAFVLNTDSPYTIYDGGVSTNFIARHFGRSIGHQTSAPLATITAGGGGKSSLIVGSMIKHYGGNYKSPGLPLSTPTSTITTVDHHALLTAHMVKFRGTSNHGQSLHKPAPTVTAGGLHEGVVECFFVKYYGTATAADCNTPMHTITTKDRIGLVEVEVVCDTLTDEQRYRAWWIARMTEEFVWKEKPSIIPAPRVSAVANDYGILVDIGMRMLIPRELFTAQGFDPDYIIDTDYKGNKITKTNQIRMVGNSVSPPVLAAVLAVNLPKEMLIN